MRNYNLVLTVLFAMSFCLQAFAQDDKTSVPMTTVTPQRSSPLGADKVMLQGVIKDVTDGSSAPRFGGMGRGGARIILSRASGKFLEELLRKEVPEIAEGAV